MTPKTILVVDDEPAMLDLCQEVLVKIPKTEIFLERHGASAADQIKTTNIDLLIADLRIGPFDGLKLLRLARQHEPPVATLMMTGRPTVESAVESMKLGAADYLTKPFDCSKLLVTATYLLGGSPAAKVNHLPLQVQRDPCFSEILGVSPVMQDVFHAIRKLAAVDIDVLIKGETGTGKELVAREIHRASRRAQHVFEALNCAGIPFDLFEDELFGHERGAFTGARMKSLGAIEHANLGTLFLDEIDQVALLAQGKLLRVLQERCFRPLGARNEIGVNVRVIAASSADLEAEITRGHFRSDLYYRIKNQNRRQNRRGHI